jgi:uncharacterized protein (TIGR03435 family)
MRPSTVAICALSGGLLGQSLQTLDTSSARNISFEVASVKPNKSDAPPRSNFPLNAGGMYTPNAGWLSASNFPLVTYIVFAYNLMGNQIQSFVPQLPRWATNDRFDIEARTPGNPSKDEMRAMMRSLLADRFGFAAHTESREVPVLAFVLAKPGKTGPQLRVHPASTPCRDTADFGSKENQAPDSLFQSVPGGFPEICNGILGVPASAPGRSRLGGRNVTIQFMADMFSQRVDPGRPMVDETGLRGSFDFLIEFVPESPVAGAESKPDAALTDGPTFMQALRDQLGIRQVARKKTMNLLVLDHIEHPSEN